MRASDRTQVTERIEQIDRLFQIHTTTQEV
jgi:hypothetical protein